MVFLRSLAFGFAFAFFCVLLIVYTFNPPYLNPKPPQPDASSILCPQTLSAGGVKLCVGLSSSTITNENEFPVAIIKEKYSSTINKWLYEWTMLVGARASLDDKTELFDKFHIIDRKEHHYLGLIVVEDSKKKDNDGKILPNPKGNEL